MRCLIVDDDELSRAFLERFVEQHGGLDWVGSCESAIEASKVLRHEDVDVIFLDVEMPGMSGLELVRSLDRRPQIVLVTAKEEYAIEAFNIEVTDYLLKPVTYARFLKAVERAERWAKREAEQLSDGDYVFIKADGRLVKLKLEDILWISAQGDYMMIHASGHKYLVHGTMKSMEAKLPAQAFTRVHRSYIVRIDKIQDIKDTTIVINRQVIPIGGSYKAGLLRRLPTI
jgi:DNA-binding LytR/AlgR family response regulator